MKETKNKGPSGSPQPKGRTAPRFYGDGGPLGCHVGGSGGIENAPAKAKALGAVAMQVFTRSPRQWRAAPIPAEKAAQFAAERQAHGVTAAVAHAIYLINLAAREDDQWRRSIDVTVDDLERCAQLGLDALVLHPGYSGESTPDQRRKRVLAALTEIGRRTKKLNVKLLLETMAGRGAVGGLEDFAWLFNRVPSPKFLGVCLDSCHLFAAGLPLHQPEGMGRLLDEIERTVGLARIGCWHLNDSLGEFGSHRDRHARLGKGKIGKDFFARLLHEPRFFGVPKILEVPGGDAAFAGDLRLLGQWGK